MIGKRHCPNEQKAWTFQTRLRHIMAEGNLTVADLARWLGRPHPTVRYWISKGQREISVPDERAYVRVQIELLEGLIKKRKGLPVPRMSARERKDYITRLARYWQGIPH